MPGAEKRKNLARLLTPRSVAVVGGVHAEKVIEQTRRFGFSGEIYAVNPKRDSLADVPCVKRVEDLPEPPDAVFLGVSRTATVETVERLAAIGAGGVVCFASGFAEVADGTDLERELVAVAGDLAVVGPNCHGVVNGFDGVALWPDEHGVHRVDRGVALISQSGNIAITLSMQERSLDLAHVLSVGNQSVLKLHDYIDALADDERVTAIGLYIEGIDDARALATAALKCAKRHIPVVAIMSGKSEAAVRTAVSHTASLAGSSAVLDAFFDRYGIIRVDSLSDLVETLKFLAVAGPLDGRCLGSMSCSGGDAAMVADVADSLGLLLPPLPEANEAALKEVLGNRVNVANPLDYHTYIWNDRPRLTACFSQMLGAGYDATLLVLDYPRLGGSDVASWDVTVSAMIDATRMSGGTGIVVSSLPETLPAHARQQLASGGVPPMQGLTECLRAIDRAAWLGERWLRLESDGADLPVGPTEKRTNGCAQALAEPAAKSLMSSIGIDVPNGCEVSIGMATEAALKIGFPVVVKTASHLAHKTEAGGVALGLNDVASVARAARSMAALGEQVRVERMLPAPVAELIVGVNNDPVVGPHLLIGSGGVWVEILRDSQVVLLPATATEIRDALTRLRLWPVLAGYRGRSGGNLDAVVDVIVRLAKFTVQNADCVAEIDINPLMVFDSPHGAIAADAFVRLSAPIDGIYAATETAT